MRFIVPALIALLPSAIKIRIYRHVFGFTIGRNVRIGLSLFVGVRNCRIDDGVRIGHLNVFTDVGSLIIERAARIGTRNLIRGGTRVRIGAYASLLRFNVLNSIPDAESVNPRTPVLELGSGSVVTNGHWIDFTDRVDIGDNVIIGGRNSSFWTHNRQRTRPITIGHHSYLGSEVRFAPGACIAPMSVVAIGAVATAQFVEPQVLIGGNPAAIVRPLKASEFALVSRKNRSDIPDDAAYAQLPPDVRSAAAAFENEMRQECLPESIVG